MTTATLVHLVRHATADHIGRVLAGRSPGVHLNEAGRAQAARLGERMAGARLAAIYSSPLERAVETAEALARPHRLGVRVENALIEIDVGAWTGRTFEELERDERWKPFNVFRSGTRAPGGELMLEAQTRGVQAVERLAREYAGGAIALVSHGDVIKGIVMHYLGVPLDLFLRFEIDPASVTTLRLDTWGARLLRLNDTGEPPAP